MWSTRSRSFHCDLDFGLRVAFQFFCACATARDLEGPLSGHSVLAMTPDRILLRATATPCWRRSAANEGLLTQGTSSDSSALTSTDSSVRDRAVVSPIAAALLLVEQTGHDNDAGAPVAGYRNRT
jgi:hypothetical protein